MKTIKLFIAIGSLIYLVGCAHPISIAPKEEGTIRTVEAPDKIKKKIGFYISPESLNLEVTTPGGGGDNVRYFPYRDLHASYQRMLNNVFEDVVRVAKASDAAELEKGGLAYVIIPELITHSGSPGFFTWPPTNFTVDLTSRIRDTSGKLINSPRVIGVASVGAGLDMMRNHELSGQLAMQDALQKMQAALVEGLGTSRPHAAVTNNSASRTSEGNEPTEVRLSRLKELLDKRLISNNDYETKKQEILNGL